MSNRASLEVTLGSRAKRQRKPADEPLRVLFLGDFSGRDEIDPDLKPHRISYETLESAIIALAPTATIELDAPLSVREQLNISSIDDFHPDSLAKSISTFRTLKILGDRLGDPATRDEALTQLAELAGPGSKEMSGPATTLAIEPQPDTEGEGEGEGDMMERLLGTSAGASPRTQAHEKVASFIQNVIGEAQIEMPSTSAEVGQRHIDELMAATMREVLMSQPLRSLERAWRSVEWLMQRLDDDTAEIYVLDVSKDNLSTHLSEHLGQLDRSALHRLFCEPTSGDPWDLFIGDYSFSLDANDLVLLTSIGALAGQACAPFIAHGDLSLCGCNSLEQLESPWDWQLPDDDIGALWAEVRSHPASKWVGLASPRFLLRQPYGPKTDPIDSFDFQELPPRPESARFLWGNPAIACAYLLGRAHAEESQLSDAGSLDIEDLPTVLFDDGTGQALQPPVEALISERAMQQIQASGLIPMLGKRNANSVRCADLTAVSSQTISFLA
jgi:type VI secretion system protein ImpC